MALSSTLDSECAEHVPTEPWYLIGPSRPFARRSTDSGNVSPALGPGPRTDGSPAADCDAGGRSASVAANSVRWPFRAFILRAPKCVVALGISPDFEQSSVTHTPGATSLSPHPGGALAAICARRCVSS